MTPNITVDENEVMLTKFLLCGGYIWDCVVLTGTHGYFAIEPGCIESSSCNNMRGDTPADAVYNFIKRFGAPWEKNYKSYASTSIADGLIPPPTA